MGEILTAHKLSSALDLKAYYVDGNESCMYESKVVYGLNTSNG